MIPLHETNKNIDTCNRDSPRVVLHVDLDAFFCQVERSLNPTLVGKPMAVQQHMDIIAVSYEARELGVTKHMPIGFIRQKYPSVKLVHVQTMGLQNDKVSYRNYRQAARSIFTLIRAFCPSEAGNDGAGKFQKTSVDEAYLEPGPRTLEAELTLSQGMQNTSEDFMYGVSRGKREAIKRPRIGLTGVPSPQKTSGAQRGVPGESSSESQEWVEEDEEPSFFTMGVARRVVGRRANKERRGELASRSEEEVDRLLEAGGLLGVRIQRELRQVLEYDCSVGVAQNKFLAKLATNLAKPKGVRVLYRRDIPSILATTSASKIPGCGGGSVAARHFAQWGIKSILDLRRVEASELRGRLGENIGAKVYDRCRGIDTDPVAPNLEPSRVSSQMSLFPHIKPVSCLGKPNEEFSPVFPWEVDRLRAHVATLVDDLLDRMKEELADRNRRPTKLSMEYHLQARGSKTQTFSLPPTRPCHPTLLPRDTLQEKAPSIEPSDSGDAVGLLPAITLVEIALTPFKRYARDGPNIKSREGMKKRVENSPVIKLNVVLLGFVNVGKPMGKDGASGLGQCTLSGMMWLGRDSVSAVVTDHDNPSSEDMGGASKDCKSPIRLAGPVAPGSMMSLSASTAFPTVELSARSCRSPLRVISAVSPTLHQLGEDRRKAPPATENSVLVCCPMCKSCLPVGDGWDAHREEHRVLETKAKLGTRSPGRRQESSLAPGRRDSRGQSGIALQEQHAMFAEKRAQHDSIVISRSTYNTPNCGANEASGPPLLLGLNGLQGKGRKGGQRSKLSELLRVAVTPRQAAQILRDDGLLQADGQTRFADLFLDAKKKCRIGWRCT